MRVLVACEFSGIVRDEFIKLGHDAVSCDLLPTERVGPHIQGDVLTVLEDGWDLMIAHPPCTHLAVSGAKYFADKKANGQQQESLEFVKKLLAAPIEKIALENPVSIISTEIRKPDQIIQPWMFGHVAIKTTCLWLKNLPKLVPTDIIPAWARTSLIMEDAPTPDRGHKRSRTYRYIAKAFATQWSYNGTP